MRDIDLLEHLWKWLSDEDRIRYMEECYEEYYVMMDRFVNEIRMKSDDV
jgi:hypothetical protein